MFKVRFTNDDEDALPWECEIALPWEAAQEFLDYIYWECEGHSWMCKFDEKPQVQVIDENDQVFLFDWTVELLPTFGVYTASPK